MSVDAGVRLLVLVCFGMRLGYETVVVYFGTRNSKDDWTMRLLLTVLGRPTQRKT